MLKSLNLKLNHLYSLYHYVTHIYSSQCAYNCIARYFLENWILKTRKSAETRFYEQMFALETIYLFVSQKSWLNWHSMNENKFGTIKNF